MRSLNPYRYKLGARLSLPLLLAGSLFLFNACNGEKKAPSEETSKEKVSPNPYVGRYRIEPGENDETLQLNEDGSLLYTVHIPEESLQRIEGHYTLNRKSLMIYLHEKKGRSEPVGIFLLSTYSTKEWGGFWYRNIRFLNRKERLPSM